MGNVESCCAYGSSPRENRTPKLKTGGGYHGPNHRLNGHSYRNKSGGDYADGSGIGVGISGHPGGGGGHFDRGGGPLRSDESVGNLQHISEREPDDWDQDPSLHPTVETIFMEKSKKSIQSKLLHSGQRGVCLRFLFTNCRSCEKT